jgi:hypothetical protein
LKFNHLKLWHLTPRDTSEIAEGLTSLAVTLPLTGA